jgi:Mrp family chromosome partitioning ATPase
MVQNNICDLYFSNEGKTFVSANLADFRIVRKKVLLIGMDFRNPRLNEYMVVQEQGVTNYLSSNDLDLNDLIVKHDGYKNFTYCQRVLYHLILQSY